MRASTFFVLFSRRTAVLILLLFTASLTYAQITPSADSYVNSAAPTTNYGAAPTLNLQPAAETSFIRFDLTAVPAGYTGSSIAKATLKLYVNTVTTAGSFNVDYVTGTWSEQTIKYNLQPALGTTIAATVPLTTASKGKYIEIDITSAMVEWLNGTQVNDGIALVANSPLVATFDSKENTAASHPPEIDIVFAAISDITTASGSGLTGGGTSGTLNLALTNSCATNQVLQWSGSSWTCAAVGTGTVTSVGVTAPSTDFIVTGSPVTTSGILGLGWLVAPDYNNTPNAIVKRDYNGNFSAGMINAATGFYLGSNPFAIGSWFNSNVFLGFSGNTTTTGVVNTATGAGALLYNTSGSSNTATGGDALNQTTTGSSNTAAGYASLQFNTTGNNNTATGVAALLNNNGNGNTASGFYALDSNNTGNYNTALGYFAEAATNPSVLTNSTAIGAFADVTQNNSLVLGSILGVNYCTAQNNCASTNVGIGTTAPQYTLDVNGTGNFTGLVKFSSSQTFPGAGTITGVTPGTDLTGGGTSGNVTLNVDTTKVVTAVLAGTDLAGGGTGGVQTLNLDTTKVPQLAAANTFTGAQTINNNVTMTASGTTLNVSGGTYGVIGRGTGSGVYGIGSITGSSIGVQGAGGTYGVLGNGSSYGVYGTSGNFGVYGYGSWGVYGQTNAANGNWAVYADGNIGATGTIGAMAFPNGRAVSVYAMASPENWFEDFGSGQLKVGLATITLDATFAQTVSPEVGYHVFVTPNGDCEGLYVAQKTTMGFQVRELHGGKSSVAFDYRIVAKRKGLERLRLEDQRADHEPAEAIRRQIASRPSHPQLPKLPKPQPQTAVTEPPK